MRTTCPYFDNLEFDIFDAGGLQCHFTMSVTIAVRIRMLSIYYLKLNLVCEDQSKSFSVRPSRICHWLCTPGQNSDI